MQENNIFEIAIKNTQILKMPKRNISTFGTTNIDYYLLSNLGKDTKIREGKVISKRPEIIKPTQISELFEGFGDYSDKYGEEMFEVFGKNAKILNYKFSNQLKTTSNSLLPLNQVFEMIGADLEKRERNLSAIIKCDEKTWQISIMKFIVEMTLKSSAQNIEDFEKRGLFPDETGISQNVRNKIEYLFKKAETDTVRKNELGKFLNDYGLFKEYEDRFFKLFK